MKSKKEERLPCPFCGNKNIWIMGHCGWYTMQCECGLESPSFSSEDDSFKYWNNRVKEKK